MLYNFYDCYVAFLTSMFLNICVWCSLCESLMLYTIFIFLYLMLYSIYCEDDSSQSPDEQWARTTIHENIEGQWAGTGSKTARTKSHTGLEGINSVVAFQSLRCWKYVFYSRCIAQTLLSWTIELASLPFQRVATIASGAISTGTGCTDTVGPHTKAPSSTPRSFVPLLSACGCPCEAKIVEMPVCLPDQFILHFHAELEHT